MDDARFDRWTRTVGAVHGRRAVVRLALGGLVSGLAAATVGDASAKPRRHHHHHHHGGGGGDGGGGGSCLPLGADCGTSGDCCSGRCSIEVITTCRRLDCRETGACAADTDCCGGYCLGGCCQGVC